MHSAKKDFHSIFIESCSSTMDIAKKIALQETMDKITCVVTKNQTAGRGRGGSVWIQSQNERQNVTSDLTHVKHYNHLIDIFSEQTDFLPVTLIVPMEKIKVPMEWITSLVGCAVFDALKMAEGFVKTTLSQFFKNGHKDSICIKWPNDIIYQYADHYKKICGILCESSVSHQDLGKNICFIGIGLNFFSFPNLERASSFVEYLGLELSESLKKDFENEMCKKEYKSVLLTKFAEFLTSELSEYLCYERSVEQLKNLILERSLPLGTMVSVNKGAVHGKFRGIDDRAALLLEGVRDPIFSGDVSVEANEPLSAECKNPLLVIDFGNSRIHMMSQNSVCKLAAAHVSYELFTDQVKSTKPKIEKELHFLVENFIPDKSKKIQILFTSVVTSEKTEQVLDHIKNYFFHIFPLIRFSEVQITEENIFSSLNITGNFEKEKLGADRALKFFFSAKQAEKTKKNTLVVSFGTAITCEGVSSTGEILENFVAPGLQMSFFAMNHYTALLPKLEPNPNLFSPEGRYWNQEIYMQRGVFLSAAATVIATMKLHEPCICYLSGGNSQQIADIVSKMVSNEQENFEISLEENIETKMLVQYSETFLSYKTEPFIPASIQKKPQTEHVLNSMLKPRILVREERNVPPKEEDFRRIGPRIEDGTQGLRIDAHMGKEFPFHSREVWQERISTGEVRVEHNASKDRKGIDKPTLVKVKPTYKLKEWDQVWLFHPQEYEPDVMEKMDVIFDDGDVCIFSKPPNMVIHAAGVYGKNTFVNFAQKLGYGDCAPVHRIDRETSGILACARKSSTRSLIANAFQKGLVRKMYLAVTKGTRDIPPRFRVTLPIGAPEKSLIRLKLWVYGNNHQAAETHFAKLASYGDYTLFACLPKTGRTNQIRIHLAAIGHWIVGDKMYHENEQVFIEFYEKGYTQWVEQQVLFPRHMLHNTGMMLEKSGYSTLNGSPVICELPHDLMESDIVQHLLEQANIPQNQLEQREHLKKLFLDLHATDFSAYPEIDSISFS